MFSEERQFACLENLCWRHMQHQVDEFSWIPMMGSTQFRDRAGKWETDVSRSDLEDLEEAGMVRAEKAFRNGRLSHIRVSLTRAGREWYRKKMNKDQERQITPADAANRTTVKVEKRKVFVGHGHHHVWKDVVLYLRDDFGLECETYERIKTPGEQVVPTLERLLVECPYAFILLTGDEETAEGKFIARANVYHEVGLWQGRHGFDRAIVLLDAAVEKFSNNQGIHHIAFDPVSPEACHSEIHRTLRRWGLVG